MTSLTASLKATLSELVRSHRVVVWYDPGGTLQGCLPQAMPDGVDQYVHDGSSLPLRVAFEEANPRLERPSVVYVPAAPEEPSWLRDLELAGCRRELDLADLIANAFQLRLEADLRAALTGREGSRLAASWSELLPASALSAADLRVALVAAALGLNHRSVEDLVLTFVSSSSADARLARAGLVPQLHKVLRAEAGWATDAPSSLTRQACAAALLLSEAVTKGGIETEGLGKVLPRPNHRPQWAAWAEKWRRLDARSFVEASDEVERSYAVKKRLRGPDAAAVQSFRSVDEIVLAEVEAKLAAREGEAALQLARERAASYWAQADREAGRPQPWGAVLAALEVRLLVAPAATELAGRPAWTLGELLQKYADRETGWWRIDDAFRRLDAHRNRLPVDLLSTLGVASARAYWDWVDALGIATGRSLEKDGWSADGWRRQGAIASDEVVRDGRRAILLADALRFDLAMGLADLLEGRGIQVTRQPALCMLPSVTVVGMAAILGSAEAPEADLGGGKLVPRSDGALLHGRNERLAGFKHRFPKAQAMELADVREGRPIPKVAETLIVYMQDIDEQGEFLPQVGRDHFEALAREIAEGVDVLLKSGYRSVLVIPDHGFLLLPEEPAPRLLAVNAGAATVRARRYLAGRPPEVEGAIRVPMEALGWHSTAVAAFPLGAAVFGLAGQVPRYLHGGPSLQETALLALTAERVTTSVPVGVRLAEPEHLDTVLPRFVLEGDRDVMFAEPRRVRVVVQSGGKVVGESEVVIVVAGEQVTAQVRLQEYGDSVEVVVEDYATRDELVRKTLPVALPAGYEDLEL